MHTVSAAEHRFELAVTAVIVANSMVMLASSVVGGQVHELLKQADVGCLWFFAAELAVRLWKARLGFFHSPWSCLDAAIIVVALLPIAGGGIAVARLGRLARSGHLLKHVAHLRLWRLVRAGIILRHARGLTAAAVAATVLLTALFGAPAAHADEPYCPPTALGCPTQHLAGWDCRYDGPRVCPPGNPQGEPPGWYGNDNCWPGAIYCPPPDSAPDNTATDR